MPVTDNAAESRFELQEDGHIAYADYRRDGGRLVIPYVFAPPELRGTGAAGRVMEGVVAAARAEGLSLVPDTSADEVGPLHVLVYPGGQGTRALARDDEHLAWVREMRQSTPLMTSVCTGSLVYAAAGLLAGRPATTHWRAYDELTAIDPSTGPRSVARPPIATPMRNPIDGTTPTSAGEMIPTIGTNSAPPTAAMNAATAYATTLTLAGS